MSVPIPSGYRANANVLAQVIETYGIRDTKKLVARAVELEDGNKYLKRSELEAAAGDLTKHALSGYRWSDNVVARVLASTGLKHEAALLREAIAHDDGNKYLKRSELEAAARRLGSALEDLGIISDLDKTVIPPHGDTLPDAPYPGVTALFREIDLRAGSRPGDTYYVTARSPDRVEEIPAWLEAHGLPLGPIATGVSSLPWVAEPEKVADISTVLDANPEQRFILFGDSSHRDPEVFRKVLEAHPDRFITAFVHKVNNPSANRVAGMILFEDYAEVAAHLLRLEVLDEPACRRVMEEARDEGLAITDSEIDARIAASRP